MTRRGRNGFADTEAGAAQLTVDAGSLLPPVILIGIFAQRHIVKGLTVGAVKGGARR